MEQEEISTQFAIYCIGKRVFVVHRLGPWCILQNRELRPSLSALCDSYTKNRWTFEKKNTGCIWKTIQIK